MSALRRAIRRPALVARRRRGTRGQGLVEFALVLPVFLVLLLALFDAGRVLYAQNTITQAARDAVRLGAVSPSYTLAKYEAIRNKVLSSAIGVSVIGTNVTGQAAVPCSTPDATSPTTCFYPDAVTAGSRVVVNVSATVPLITPLIGSILGGSITLTTRSVGLVQCTGC
jgi:Flp pilus assembly protein TadG